MEGDREFARESVVIEADRGPIEPLRDGGPEGGFAGTRARGCCRIRRRPDAPRPCSCSVRTGDLEEECGQPMNYILRNIRDIRCRRHASVAPAPHVTNLASCSAAVMPASNENRIRALSAPDGFLGAYASRFPVLRFLGMTRSPGGWVRRPRDSSACMSWPVNVHELVFIPIET